MTLNCITVDDEPLALGLVSSFVEQTPFLHLHGRYINALDALEVITKENIHLVYLDIQMPELTGMELAKVLSQSSQTKTRIVFTTAYNQFAVQGYEVDALGYLLKPFGYNQFLATAMKAKKYFETVREAGNEPELDSGENYLFVKSDYKLVRIDFDAILFVESFKDYVKIHQVSGAPVVSHSSLKAIEEKLPAGKFIRIHRSFIVSVGKVDSISKSAVHIGNVDIPVGDLYKDAFKELFAKWQ
jgi:two-component system, LytTR family, response regulator LytT